jgi:hypothetical protein
MMRQEEHYYLGEKLHTEVLEEKYGKISLQLLHDDNKVREVLLTDKLDIARTYALTIRSNAWRNNKEIVSVNDVIKAGEPIGKAFKTRGFTILKNVLAVYPVGLPEWLRHAFMVEDHFAKTRITEFLVSKSGKTFQYGFVAEVYSPDFRKPVINIQDEAQVALALSSQQHARVDELKHNVSSTLLQIAPVLSFF